jgi:hypothetical protein
MPSAAIAGIEATTPILASADELTGLGTDPRHLSLGLRKRQNVRGAGQVSKWPIYSIEKHADLQGLSFAHTWLPFKYLHKSPFGLVPPARRADFLTRLGRRFRPSSCTPWQDAVRGLAAGRKWCREQSRLAGSQSGPGPACRLNDGPLRDLPPQPLRFSVGMLPHILPNASRLCRGTGTPWWRSIGTTKASRMR